MKHSIWAIVLAALLTASASAQAGRANGRGGAPPMSPAAKRPPASKSNQTFPPEQVQAGESRFVAQCGFCHGRDAQGGESGPDLTRSVLVAEDVRGNKLRPLIQSGRPANGMPAFSLSSADLDAVVAFIHDTKAKMESSNGNRRTVEVADLRTGNAESGKAYFNGAGGCAKCHSTGGPFGKVGDRFQGLALLQRMLYPRPRARNPEDLPTVTVTVAPGKSVSGRLTYRDEFVITLVDAENWSHSFPLAKVKAEVDGGLRYHADQLDKYTDEDMHNVFAYLETLK